MRRKLLFVITTFVLSLITTSQALAQDSRWTGASLSDIAGGKQGRSEEHTSELQSQR